jgi:dihydroorotate dehydrogenase
VTIYPLIRDALFALSPESSHRISVAALRLWGRLAPKPTPGPAIELMGLTFPNRVGLAGGFDKNAQAIDGFGRLGFGFIEVGTLTPRAQPGQATPRLFRLTQSRALINRMGFPNDGAEMAAARLRQRSFPGIVGANIGKNADTPVEHAVDDYLSCLRALYAVCNYIAVNISSPNTAALRELHAPERLEPLLTALLTERRRLIGGHRSLPILLKISPDLDATSLECVARVARGVSLDGIIATNTTVRRDRVRERGSEESGGLSGPPLHALSVQMVSALRHFLGPQFPIIGVGGIDSAQAARRMHAAGADLIQVYTGLVYRGPSLVSECRRALELDTGR